MSTSSFLFMMEKDFSRSLLSHECKFYECVVRKWKLLNPANMIDGLIWMSVPGVKSSGADANFMDFSGWFMKLKLFINSFLKIIDIFYCLKLLQLSVQKIYSQRLYWTNFTHAFVTSSRSIMCSHENSIFRLLSQRKSLLTTSMSKSRKKGSERMIWNGRIALMLARRKRGNNKRFSFSFFMRLRKSCLHAQKTSNWEITRRGNFHFSHKFATLVAEIFFETRRDFETPTLTAHFSTMSNYIRTYT